MNSTDPHAELARLAALVRDLEDRNAHLRAEANENSSGS